MRKYQPVWEAIKRDGIAILRVAQGKEDRIIKAVRKEKTLDNVWKLTNSEKGIRYKLKETIDSGFITFELEQDKSSYVSDMKF